MNIPWISGIFPIFPMGISHFPREFSHAMLPMVPPGPRPPDGAGPASQGRPARRGAGAVGAQHEPGGTSVGSPWAMTPPMGSVVNGCESGSISSGDGDPY